MNLNFVPLDPQKSGALLNPTQIPLTPQKSPEDSFYYLLIGLCLMIMTKSLINRTAPNDEDCF